MGTSRSAGHAAQGGRLREILVYGEAFKFLGYNIKKFYIFQRVGGPCKDRTYDQLIKRGSYAGAYDAFDSCAAQGLIFASFLARAVRARRVS